RIRIRPFRPVLLQRPSAGGPGGYGRAILGVRQTHGTIDAIYIGYLVGRALPTFECVPASCDAGRG
ncbi:MAG TPA: hypothetical protein PKD61_06670, partial [Polyangiaceae bacterium]|nr:hypothetical protein [Polyangiaceae bacterium]